MHERPVHGYVEDGSYAAYATVRADFAYTLPNGLDVATATPLLCAGIIGYRALRRADVRDRRAIPRLDDDELRIEV